MTKQKNAFTAGAAVPANPCEGCSYRHRDNAPNGYFDEMLEHSREEMRHACRLVPIEQKPCMENVLFGEAAAKIVAQQCLALVAHSLRSTLTLMTELNKAGGGWGDLENDTSLLLELGMEQVQRLRDNPPEALEEFSHQWFRISSMVRLLAQNYPDKSSVLFRFLDAARREFEVLPDLWDHVAGMAEEGDSYGAPPTHQQEGGAA